MYVTSFYFVCTVNINLLYRILGRTPQLRRVTREAVTPASVLYRTIGSIRGSITALWAKPMSHGSDLVTAVPTPNAAESKGKPSCLRLITGLRSVTTANMDTPYNHDVLPGDTALRRLNSLKRCNAVQDWRTLKLHRRIFTYVNSPTDQDRGLLIYVYSCVDVFLYDYFIR